MGESKQVKVDNWGIFFLQRLQTFFNKTYFCDLTLQFEDNVQLKVHRLVMNACTEYFQVLEQTCEVINDCLIMPPDLQADVVVPIVNFMYTGILEFQTSIFDRLYSTARLMNMTVLTKLLDAQKVPISPIPKPINKRSPISPITWNLQGKKISPKTMDPDLPEPLPGRKLPIWKRKSVPSTIAYRSDMITGLPDPLTTKYFKSNVDEAPKPTRFEWPDDDDTNFDTNSFDEISYTSKPIIIPQREKSPKPSTSSNNFEELKRTSVSVKRPASPIYNDNKKVNIQDVKEYIKEQKLRSDYIDYDDSEAADNDLQTYENDNDSDDDTNKDDVFDQNAEDTSPNKSILKNDTSTSHNKRVRFSLEGKENAATKSALQKPSSAAATIKTNATSVDMTNHTKIITEVLKKYPHLVKKNKNIRLKILAKGANAGTPGIKPVGTPMKVIKPASKVSYMVMKPGESNSKTSTTDNKKDGHWSCHRCSNPNPLQFDAYYLYRKHLTEVHNEKTDSQMCNICGHISRKQNMLMYHKYVKHNITPPPSYQFPMCKDCSYIALSPALLIKHQINHTHQSLVCAECNTTFPTKSALISHIQLTGHSDKNNCPTYDCTYCTKKFISDETLFQHIKNNHKAEARRDNIISEMEEDEADVRKENIITAEEIDALEEQGESCQQEIVEQVVEVVSEKPKEKIKILSDVKVTTNLKNSKLQPVKLLTTNESQQEATQVVDTQPLEPSSEAESLSNVASGIAASLGLVNTIVVLDENQFILQSQDGNQENMIAGNSQNIILPDVSNINNIQNLVSQHQVITTDANSIISQATLSKSNIASTDELVMVLTDHDYSDAANNTVLTSENSNIVVLYSHPVQNQDGQYISQPGNLMINSDMGLVEVSNNYAVANTVPIEEKPCEETIELIQQEINNHLESEHQEIPQPTEKIVEEQIIAFDEDKSDELVEEQEEPESENNLNIPKEILVNSEPEKMEVDPIEQQMTEEHQEVVEFAQHDIIKTEDESYVPAEETEKVVPISDIAESISDVTESISEMEQPASETEQHDSEIEQVPEMEQPDSEMEQPDSEMQQPESQMQQPDSPEIEQAVSVSENVDDNHFEEPMEIEESIEMIQQEIRRTSTELNENIIPDDIPPYVPENVEPELNSERECSQIQEESESVQEVLETNEDIQTAVTNDEETEESELTIENQETINEEEQEVEHMEVDSAKFISNPDIAENETENVQPIITETDTTTENTEQSKFVCEDMIPDSEEEKCQYAEELNLQPEEITESENMLLAQDQEIIKDSSTQQINEESTENIENEIENMSEQNSSEIHANCTELEVNNEENQETSEETVIQETKEVCENEQTTEVTEESTETSNSEVDESQDTELSEEVQAEKEINNANEELVSSPEESNQEIDESKSIAAQPDTTNNKESLTITNSKISNLLDDWDDGDTDSQQSDTPKPISVTENRRTINTLINDWEDEEET